MKECSAGSSFPYGCKYQYKHTKRTREKQNSITNWTARKQQKDLDWATH